MTIKDYRIGGAAAVRPTRTKQGAKLLLTLNFTQRANLLLWDLEIQKYMHLNHVIMHQTLLFTIHHCVYVTFQVIFLLVMITEENSFGLSPI